jgi:ribosomal subunit interface protein
VDIIFKGRHTGLQERFRRYATAKLAKIGKLDQKAIRIDVEVSQERNPRQSARRERVELTIRSRGPVIRAEAAADDRFVALDRAIAKLEARLRRACDRRKDRHAGQMVPDVGHHVDQLDGQFAEGLPATAAGGGMSADGTPSVDGSVLADGTLLTGGALLADGAPLGDTALLGRGSRSDRESMSNGEAPLAAPPGDIWGSGYGGEPGGPPRSGDFVPIAMEGDGPLVVREKFHAAAAMTIDQALLEMELVGHDFYLFCDQDCHLPSVVYRRRGYDYGVIRLVEEPAGEIAPAQTGGAARQHDRRVGQNRAAR